MTAGRQRVADAALRMFSERGYAGVGMREIAAELLIQAPSLYSHYPSKRALFCSSVAPLLDRVDALLLTAPIGGDSRSRLAWLTDYIKAFAEHPQAARILGRDPALQTEGILADRPVDHPTESIRVLQRLGAPDEMTAQAIIGGISRPIFDGLRPEQSEALAARLEPLFGEDAAHRAVPAP